MEKASVVDLLATQACGFGFSQLGSLVVTHGTGHTAIL